MRMTLERMSIQNFKGTRELTIDFGDLTKISGMNATGKTTIPDAFCWCIWNKDSHGNTPGTPDFREKPLDEFGEEIHNLDTTVELICNLDGKPFNLRRTQRENWVKKRGSAEAVFQGNVSTYWINDVETKLTDFKIRISQIANEEVFRLIGSLSAFNKLDWKKRREQLMALSGTDVDGMLLQRDEYRPLADACAQRGIEVDDMRKVLADQRKRTNDELKMIPVRIDEARKALPVFKPREVSDAQYIVDDSLRDIERINGYITEAKATAGQTNVNGQILAMESEALSLQRVVNNEHQSGLRALERERDASADTYRRYERELKTVTEAVATNQLKLAEVTKRREKLRADYSAEYDMHFEAPEIDGICPTCKQPLPEAMIQTAIAEARNRFETERKDKLMEIRRAGLEAKAEMERLVATIAEGKRDEEDAKERMESAQREMDKALADIRDYPAEPDYGKEPRIAELKRQVAELRAQQSKAPDEKIREYENRRAELNAIIDRNRTVLARHEAGLETEKRIKALEQQQKDCASRVADLEKLMALTENFVQDRCHALEDSINALFPTVRWKLFETQINGGISDVCQCYVPCDSGLVAYGTANTASRVNADIEIINVLSEHHGIHLPLFFDNAESVNRIVHTDSQLITLAVSTDPELKIEKEAS